MKTRTLKKSVEIISEPTEQEVFKDMAMNRLLTGMSKEIYGWQCSSLLFFFTSVALLIKVLRSW